jgi:hypothetical protein
MIRANAVSMFSAEDGRLLARLEHPAEEILWPGNVWTGNVVVGPSGRRIATISDKRGEKGDQGVVVRLWDVSTWKVVTVNKVSGVGGSVEIRYWMDDAPGGGSVIALGWEGCCTVLRAGRDEPVAQFQSGSVELLGRVGDLAHDGDGQVYDMRTWQRLFPPPGRRFHPDLARFSPDGRFVNAEGGVIDTRTDKQFAAGVWHKMPGFGLIANLSNVQFDRPVDNRAVQFLPPADRLNFPPDLLELWAQVAVRGELDAERRFVPWDEATWEKKRQELSAMPAAYPDFPFPGYVATDKLHWLRQEYENAKDTAKPDIAAQLLARAEAMGDKAEAVRWRAVLNPPKPPAK